MPISDWIAAARQRLQDVMREVRIRSLSASVSAEMAAGRKDMAREAWAEMVKEINARSPQQIARLERRQGIRK